MRGWRSGGGRTGKGLEFLIASIQSRVRIPLVPSSETTPPFIADGETQLPKWQSPQPTTFSSGMSRPLKATTPNFIALLLPINRLPRVPNLSKFEWEPPISSGHYLFFVFFIFFLFLSLLFIMGTIECECSPLHGVAWRGLSWYICKRLEGALGTLSCVNFGGG